MEDSIACSPEIKNTITGIFERMLMYGDCDPKCEYYQECIKKHKVKNNRFPLWEEVDSTRQEIIAEICHYNWKENKLKTWHLK